MLRVAEAIKKSEQTLADLSSDEETIRIYYERENHLMKELILVVQQKKEKLLR
ncbi:MAG: hypothetical protein ACI33I_13250 [Clostridium sp.]